MRIVFAVALSVLVSACGNPWASVPMDSLPKPLQSALGGPRHFMIGNYCGFGSRTGDLSVKPVNKLDEACFRHDICYIDRKNLCGCNQTLVGEAKAIRDDPAQPQSMRRDAGLLLATFAFPFCKIFPEGVLPPRSFDKSTIYKLDGKGEAG
jgi:hypothetical protein